MTGLSEWEVLVFHSFPLGKSYFVLHRCAWMASSRRSKSSPCHS